MGLQAFFNPQEIGRSLKEVAVDIIQTESQNVVSRWFHSGQEADLFIWIDEKQNVIKQQVSFYGQIVEWNILEGVRTGFLLEEETKEKGVKGSEIIQYDDAPQLRSLNQAIEVLRHVEALSDQDRNSLLDNFIQGKHVGLMDPLLFLEKYGRPVRRKSLPFLKKMGLWLKKVFSLK